MGWETSDRKAELPRGWATIRTRILRRDGYRCQAKLTTGKLCGASANQVDHIIPGLDHSDANLRALCRWHHDRKSAREGVAARAPRPTKARPPESHPALRRA